MEVHGISHVKIEYSFVSVQRQALYTKTRARFFFVGDIDFHKNIVLQQSVFLFS